MQAQEIRYTRMDSLWSFGNLGFNLINFVDRKNFLANILNKNHEQEPRAKTLPSEV